MVLLAAPRSTTGGEIRPKVSEYVELRLIFRRYAEDVCGSEIFHHLRCLSTTFLYKREREMDTLMRYRRGKLKECRRNLVKRTKTV